MMRVQGGTLGLAMAVLGLVTTLMGCTASSPPGAGTGGATDLQTAEKACKRLANQEADRRSSAIHGEDVSGLSGPDPRAQMAAYEARRLYERAFTSCMERQGFAQRRGPTAGAADAVEAARDRLRW